MSEMSDPESHSESNSNRAANKKRRVAARRRNRTVLIGLIVVVLALVGGGWWLTTPPSATHRMQMVTISRGTRITGIGRLLERQGIIRNTYAFVLEAKLSGAGNVRAGRYRLYEDMSLHDVLDALVKGPHSVAGEHSVTIPEGYTVRQIADLLQAKGVTDGEEFYRLATSRKGIEQLHIAEPWFQTLQQQKPPLQTLEGYLFPDTYDFQPHIAPSKVVETLLTNFGNRFVRPYQQEIGTGTHNLHEIVTIASLIEREAEIEGDRARIAGVIENRLQRHQKLQIDATVLYALGHHKNRVLYKDLKVRSPYNTYAHPGLPPGPIASPGLPSLLAALKPEKHDFLYYVARPNGAHIFTRTEAEHAAAIRKVQTERSNK